MQSDSSSLDTLKESLLSAVDTNYNVTQPETVLKIISQLETMEITRDQLHSTRLGREINNIRQKIDARKKSVQQQGVYPDSIIQIAHRAKKLLKSWQGLLNTSQTETSTTNVPPTLAPPTIPTSPPIPVPTPPAPPPVTPVNPPVTVNGDSHESTSPNSDGNKPRLILKVKFNPKIGAPQIDGDSSKIKRKHDPDANGHQTKRRKTHLDVPTAISSPHSPSPALIESSTSLPRIKTTQQLLMEMQMNQPDVLSTQNPTVNAILQNKIIDASLHEPNKVDYNALHHGRESSTNSIISPPNASTKRSSSAAALATTNTSTSSTTTTTTATVGAPIIGITRRPSSTTHWENGTSAGGSPLSPSSSSSSSLSSWPPPTNIPEPPHAVPLIPKKKRRRKSPTKENENEQTATHSPVAVESSRATFTLEQSTPSTSDLVTLCSAYKTVAELTEAHCRRVRAEHDARELEARPELLLVPLEQLAFVYERERTEQSSPSSQLQPNKNNSNTSTATSLTSIHLFQDDPNRVALPFIDCPLEFDLTLDDFVIQDIPQ